MQPKFRVAVGALAILVCSGGAANATPISAADLLAGFTNIVLGDLTTNVETEGPLFVGGSYGGSGATVNSDGLPNADLGGGITGTLVVGGNVNATNVNLQSGNAQIGGAVNGNVNNNGSGTVFTGVAGIPIAGVASAMQGLSGELAANNTNTPGGTANTADQNNINFVSGSGDADLIQYFNIDGSVLQTGTFTGITAPADVTTIINVGGTDITVGVNANQALDDVLFNFYEATNLTISSTFNYSVLAPFADVTLNGGGIFGNLVSNNLQQNAEVRPYNSGTNFNGTLPQDDPLAISAPATLGLMMTGLGLITLVVQRRRAKA